jgi:predicted AlkP superfamily phosphohydrolase/phosphomutase
LEDQTILIHQGEWSGWLTAEFVLIPHIASVHGMVRVFAKQLQPGLEIYVSPINLDPADPALPISYPEHWSAEVETAIGRYSTLGIPEDTSALRQDVLNLAEFREQADLAFKEETKLLDYSLQQFKGGLLFFYFSSVDQNSHILWGKHEDELLKVYREVDACVGKVRRKEPNAKLIVISDHGFTTFDRAVNLNTWLKQNGFGAEAYAVGLNGLYTTLGEPLREKLLTWRDDDGRTVIDSVTATHPTPENRNVAPDYLVGYAAGYRASWQTALGEAPPTLIDNNNDAWIGDHCVDPNIVPGVLFSSEKIEPKAPRLEDVTAAVLARFGVAPPIGYHGSVF